MHWLDILSLATLAFQVVYGIYKGFIFEVIRMAGLLVGGFIALTFSNQVSAFIAPYIAGLGPQILSSITFMALWVLVYLAALSIAALLTEVASMLFVGWLNRLLGGVSGFLRGAFIVFLILISISVLTSFSKQNQIKTTYSYRTFSSLLPLAQKRIAHWQ